jgi:hypothetical protein
MKRTKRINIRRIALGLTVAALVVPAGAQAKPQPGPTYYVAQSQGSGSSPDDRTFSKATSVGIVTPHLGQGRGLTSSPDDRSFSKATIAGRQYTSESVSSSDNGQFGAAAAFALVLLAMSAVTLMVWRNRKGTLSPA